MYIKIEPVQCVVPQISFKRDRTSNVIKQSELRLYQDAQALLDDLKGQVDEYQRVIELQSLRLIDEKEQELNCHIKKVFDEKVESWEAEQSQWLAAAENKLSECLTEQKQYLCGLKKELKCAVVEMVKSKLSSITQDETLIRYLVDVLHTEIDDTSRSLKVDTTVTDSEVMLSIEDDERVICISTTELIMQLKKGLDALC